VKKCLDKLYAQLGFALLNAEKLDRDTFLENIIKKKNCKCFWFACNILVC